jgi:hypothetical protein
MGSCRQTTAYARSWKVDTRRRSLNFVLHHLSRQAGRLGRETQEVAHEAPPYRCTTWTSAVCIGLTARFQQLSFCSAFAWALADLERYDAPSQLRSVPLSAHFLDKHLQLHLKAFDLIERIHVKLQWSAYAKCIASGSRCSNLGSQVHAFFVLSHESSIYRAPSTVSPSRLEGSASLPLTVI